MTVQLLSSHASICTESAMIDNVNGGPNVLHSRTAMRQHQPFQLSASAVSLRMQVDPQSTEFKSLLLERAYADVLLCGFLLFLIVWNFMG